MSLSGLGAGIREEGRQQGIQEGRKQEREANIFATISDYLEEDFSKNKIILKLQKRFPLTLEQAEYYYNHLIMK